MRCAAAVFMAVLCCATLTAMSTTAAQAQSSTAVTDSAILAIIQRRVDDGLSTGIVVGLIGRNGQRRTVAYGASGTPRALDSNTVFEIGSITKTFTATVLADMVHRGEVRLDDPVAKFLPGSTTTPSQGDRHITLLDLATQSSGLPSLPDNFNPKHADNPYVDYTSTMLYEYLSKATLNRPIGSAYEYSNLGVALLTHALALKAGKRLEALYRTRVFDPLGMNDTRIVLTPSMRERLALGHDDNGRVTSNWDFDVLGGAGALRSTLNDMLKYIAANIAADVDSTKGSLAPAMHLAHKKQRPAGSSVMNIGLAWHLLSAPGGANIVWHNGGTGGYRTFCGFDAAAGVGVIVLSNSNTSVDDIGFHLLAPVIPLAPPPKVRMSIALPVATLDRYVGEYELAPTFHIVVTREGDALVTQATGQGKNPIYAEKENEFFLRGVDAQITFVVDAAGRVTGMVLHQNGRNTPASKVK